MTVDLLGFSHGTADDVDILLVGPNGSRNLTLMSDRGQGAASNVNITLSDSAASALPAVFYTSGTFRPTNTDTTETDITFGTSTGGINSPTPAGSATIASVFGGTAIAGNWRLVVVDDLALGTGSLTSWRLNITTQETSTTITGTAGDDILRITSPAATSGSYQLNGDPSVTFSSLLERRFSGGTGVDFVAGGIGVEIIVDTDGLDGDSYNGAGGTDTIDYSSLTLNATTIDIEVGTATDTARRAEILRNFENVNASQGNDIVYGTQAGNNVLTGNGGSDKIFGLGGNDTLLGSEGNDALDGGSGDDSMSGGDGSDTYYINSTQDIVTETNATAVGGSDTVISTIDYTLGVLIENLLLAGTGSLDGDGNTLANALTGNSAANALRGLDGKDTLQGGGGNDTLTGGAGADRFNFDSVLETGNTSATRDVIKDFTRSSVFSRSDLIDLATIDANGNAAGAVAFTFLASKGAAFTGVKGQEVDADQRYGHGKRQDNHRG